MLFSSYGINMQDFRNGGSQVIDYSVVLSMRRKESCEFILLELLQPWVEVCPKTFNENRLFNAFTSLPDN